MKIKSKDRNETPSVLDSKGSTKLTFTQSTKKQSKEAKKS